MLFKKRKRNPDLNLTPESVLHSREQALVLPKDTRQRQGIFKGKLFPTTRLPRVRQTYTGCHCSFCGCVALSIAFIQVAFLLLQACLSAIYLFYGI